MRDYITPLGGFLVIGGLVVLAYAIDKAWANRIRAQVAERKREQDWQRRYDRMWRRIFAAPSPVTLTLHGYNDDASAADFLILDSGCSPRVVEG